MTTSLDTIRYHSGIAGEEVADMVDSLEREVSSLREQVEKLTEESVVLRASSRSKLETISSLELQVEKLTKERDTEIARNRPLQSLIKSTEETKSFLLKKSEENEAIIAAANALENIASTSSSTRIRRVANDALTAIRARRKA